MAKKTQALQKLIDLANSQKRIQYPNVPDYALPRTSYSTTDANGLTRAIVDFIDLNGGWATRISTEGRYIEALGHRIPSSVKREQPTSTPVTRVYTYPSKSKLERIDNPINRRMFRKVLNKPGAIITSLVHSMTFTTG